MILNEPGNKIDVYIIMLVYIYVQAFTNRNITKIILC